MRKFPLLRTSYFILMMLAFQVFSFAQDQTTSKIDLGKDTISRTDVIGAKNTYLNSLKAFGQKATEQINLPVDKLSAIVDACNKNNISDVAVIIITLRQSDIARYRRLNPTSTATDAELKGSQMLVFKVPRQAFAGAAAAKVKLSNNNPLMLSLLSAGLVLLDKPFTGLSPASGNLYFSFGSICPPPASCDTL